MNECCEQVLTPAGASPHPPTLQLFLFPLKYSLQRICADKMRNKWLPRHKLQYKDYPPSSSEDENDNPDETPLKVSKNHSTTSIVEAPGSSVSQRVEEVTEASCDIEIPSEEFPVTIKHESVEDISIEEESDHADVLSLPITQINSTDNIQISSSTSNDWLEVVGVPIKKPVEIVISSDEEADAVAIPQHPYSLRKRRRQDATPSAEGDFSDSEDIDEKLRFHCSKSGECATRLDETALPHNYLKRPASSRRLKKPFSDTCWNVWACDLDNKAFVSKLQQFFKKFGSHFKHLHWTMKKESCPTDKLIKKSLSVLKFAISQTKILWKISLWYDRPENNIVDVIDTLSKLYKKGKLESLTAIELETMDKLCGVGTCGLEALIRSGIPFQELELDQFLQEGEVNGLLEELFETYKDTLTEFASGKGFVGLEAPELTFSVPSMKNLRSLNISASDWFRFIDRKYNERSEDPGFGNVCVKFTGDLPNLESLSLGQCVIVEDLPILLVNRLKRFWCLNIANWNLLFEQVTLPFPRITTLAFPVELNVPTFIEKFDRFFPNLKCLYVYAPSQSFLHSLFTHFAYPKLEELTIYFQFDFPLMLEQCLFPQCFMQSTQSASVQLQIDILQSYKWSKEYCKYFQVEFPLTSGEVMSAEGLKRFRSLKKLHLDYCGREPLPLPHPNEDRLWDDPECQFLHENKFSFSQSMEYPLSAECFHEILKLNLNGFTWRKLQVPKEVDLMGYRRTV